MVGCVNKHVPEPRVIGAVRRSSRGWECALRAGKDSDVVGHRDVVNAGRYWRMVLAGLMLRSFPHSRRTPLFSTNCGEDVGTTHELEQKDCPQ